MNISQSILDQWAAENSAGRGYSPEFESMDQVKGQCESAYLNGVTVGYVSGSALILDVNGPWACDVIWDSRYLVRRIANADMAELGRVIGTTDQESRAKDIAAGDYSPYGCAIVDTLDSTVDWGHCVTPLGETPSSMEVE